MASGSITLAEHPGDMVVIVCDRCDRRGTFHKIKLIKRLGPDAALPDVLRTLALGAVGPTRLRTGWRRKI